MRSENGRRGNVLLEFTLAGIPIVFLLIAIFEVSRGMWLYVTLAHAAREAARYASVHGHTCSVEPNACAVTVGDVAGRIKAAGLGLIPEHLTVNLGIYGGGAAIASAGPVALTALLGSTAAFGSQPAATAGKQVVIGLSYPFTGAIAMLWPGATPVEFGTVRLSAQAADSIQF